MVEVEELLTLVPLPLLRYGAAVLHTRKIPSHCFENSHHQLLSREFLGLVNFHRRFIPHYAQLLEPLTGLLRNKKNLIAPIDWGARATESFTAVKTSLADAAFLLHFVPEAPDVAVGAMLQ